MTPYLLMAVSAALIIAAGWVAALRMPRLAFMLALTGEAAAGGAGLAKGFWPLPAGAWGTGAYLAWRWLKLEREARRR